MLHVRIGGLDYLLVGDNERDDTLFLLSLTTASSEPIRPMAMSLQGAKIGDIEAIAALQGKGMLVMGSHGRNKSCERKKKRRRFAEVRIVDGSLRIVHRAEKPVIAGNTLFVRDRHPRDAILSRVALAIDASERRANSALGSEAACRDAGALLVEGLAVLESGGGSHAWAGLRSPTVRWNGKEAAVLMRMADRDSFRFDAAALILLDGRGIRELHAEGRWLWGIGGGPEDGTNNFVLWRVPREAVKPGSVLTPEIVGALPTASEGLAIVNDVAHVFVDGDIGTGGSRCMTPGRWVQFRLAGSASQR